MSHPYRPRRAGNGEHAVFVPHEPRIAPEFVLLIAGAVCTIVLSGLMGWAIMHLLDQATYTIRHVGG